MWVIIQNGEQEGPFETEQEAYSYIVAYWPEWRMKESFEVKKVG